MKRILAWIAIGILVAMYLTTLVMAIFDSTATMSMFKGCIAVTIFVPVVMYGYMLLHRYAMSKKNEGMKSDGEDKSGPQNV